MVGTGGSSVDYLKVEIPDKDPGDVYDPPAEVVDFQPA